MDDTLTRSERDSFGDIDVPDDAWWGAQTQRSLASFAISTERLPPEFIAALAEVKRACASVNGALGLLPAEIAAAVVRAADEVTRGEHTASFPVSVWQTGSGTHTNMNMNEVLANRASVLLGGRPGRDRKVHPNDHVNLGQSSNDVFPTAMHVAAARSISGDVLPAVRELRSTFEAKSSEFATVVKIGRTHLQDAIPVTVGQEISAWSAQLRLAASAIEASLPAIVELAIGGTAVGTGLNAPPRFGEHVAAELAERLGLPFVAAANTFAALAGHEAALHAHGGLKTLAAALMKIANDIRLLASGPRCGIGEYRIPSNEPGSSIMPGKVNPTQCEALTMACAQVFGNDVAVTIGASSGHLQLNVFKPLIAYGLLQSARLLADAVRSFDRHCARGLDIDRARIADLVGRSLMLVTALTPLVGYDKAAAVARFAEVHGTTLREAALIAGIPAEDFDRVVRLDDMV